MYIYAYIHIYILYIYMCVYTYTYVPMHVSMGRAFIHNARSAIKKNELAIPMPSRLCFGKELYISVYVYIFMKSSFFFFFKIYFFFFFFF